MTDFKDWPGKKIERLYLVVWPPWGEADKSNIDLSFGFAFKDNPDKLCVISVEKNDLWLPHVLYQSLPRYEYPWDAFDDRMRLWMAADEGTDLIMEFEYYNVTACDLFRHIVNSEIVSIEFLCIEGIPDPFGIKIYFKDDYIISMPLSDGNTAETALFNGTNYIKTFEKLGKIQFKPIY